MDERLIIFSCAIKLQTNCSQKKKINKTVSKVNESKSNVTVYKKNWQEISFFFFYSLLKQYCVENGRLLPIQYEIIIERKKKTLVLTYCTDKRNTNHRGSDNSINEVDEQYK